MSVELQILSIAVALFFGGVGLYFTIRKYRDGLPYVFTWSKVEQGVDKLIAAMKREQFEPKLILATGRGGAIVASLLADRMGNKPRPLVLFIDREHHRDGEGRRHVVIRYDIADVYDPPLPILLVAGVAAAGITFDAYKEWLKGRGVPMDQVKTAVLIENSETAFAHANYHVEKSGIQREKIFFPWYAKSGPDFGEPRSGP
jgi:hypoxanthine phosphoribosyltransferase